MKYLFFSFDGQNFPIAYHLQQEGYDVIVGQVQDKKNIVSSKVKESSEEDKDEKELRLSLFNNMLEKIPAEKLLEKMRMITNPSEYFVFFDFNNLFKYSEQIKNLGFYGNFPEEEDHLLELDRDRAKEFVKNNYPRLNVPEVIEFSKIEDAKKFIEISEELWVIKGKDETAKTFIPDTDDVILARNQLMGALDTFQKDYEKSGFILEYLIPSVVEITPEKIYYDGVPLAITINIENKPFGSGNISVQTGCAADLVFPISLDARINEIAFPPIVDEIAKSRKGLFFWDASILINRKGGKMYFGEFCSNRVGYNSFFTELAQATSVNQFFENVSNKLNPFTLGTVGTSIRIFNLLRDPKTNKVLSGINVDFKAEIQKDLWLWDVEKNDGRIVTTGLDWNLGIITGSGRSINDAVEKMYENNDKFSFFGAYYRSKADFLSLDYPTSILNRLNYGLDHNLYTLPFNVRVGQIK